MALDLEAVRLISKLYDEADAIFDEGGAIGCSSSFEQPRCINLSGFSTTLPILKGDELANAIEAGSASSCDPASLGTTRTTATSA